MRMGLISLALALAAPSLVAAQEAPPKTATPAKPDKAGKTVGEVVVSGQAAAVQSSIDRRSYSVAGDLQAQTGAIADALRHVPSVEVDVQGNVSLRGDPNVTILIDGKPSSLFEGDNKAQALQQLPADQIERVEVITNPSAEFRADGTGGIINLISKHARGTGLTGSVRANLGDGRRANASTSLGYNSNRLTVSGDLGVRHDTQKLNQADDRLQLDPRGGFDAVDQAQVLHFVADSVNARLAVDYDLTPRTRIGAETHGNFTDFHLSGPTHFGEFDPAGAFAASFDRDLDIVQKRAAAEVSANLRQKLAGDGDYVMSLSYEGINDPRVRSGHTSDVTPAAPDAFDQQRINYHLRHTELKGDLTQPFADMSKLKLGFDLDAVDNDYRNRGFAGAGAGALVPDLALTDLFKFRQTVSAAYATYERPIGALTVLAGLRVEEVQLRLDQASLGHVDEMDYLRAYPSLHLGWKLSDSQQLSASYSHRVQRPQPSDFNGFRFLLDPLNFRAGNPHLKPQQTQSFELGYERREGPGVLLATLYYRENRDGVADVLHDLGGGVFLTERDNAAQSRSAGLELVASGKVTKTLSYNLSTNVGWKQLDSLGPLFAPTRSLLAGSARGGLTWQATPDDLFQLNAFLNAKGLTPQGTLSPVMGIDLGYRRKLTDKLFLVMTAQDMFHSFHGFQSIDTPILVERIKSDLDTRQLRVGFSWAFGGGKPKEPAFEFQSSGGGPPS